MTTNRLQAALAKVRATLCPDKPATSLDQALATITALHAMLERELDKPLFANGIRLDKPIFAAVECNGR